MTKLIRRVREQDGFTIMELMASLSILAVGFFALAGALGIGFRQVALGRQRQTAAEAASARIEHLRSVPYDGAALSSQPVRSSDPENPDFFVSPDGTQFDYDGDGTYDEDLLVDDGGGQVLHIEDPVVVGTTTVEVYQYVTWADQANGVKRLSVVIKYKAPAVNGVTKFLRMSSFFTRGTITVSGAVPSPGQGTAAPTSDPSPLPSGGCSGDTSGPTGDFDLASQTGSQTGYTASTTVSVAMDFTDPCTPITVKLSNDGVTYGEDFVYDPNNPAVSWTIAAGDGTKSVWAQARDAASNIQTFGPRSIVLDATPPTVPGSLARTVSCAGTDRTVSLSWGTSTDANFSGYRVYRSVESGAWEVLVVTSVSSATDTHKKTLDSVRYYAVGYDKAGNESDATNIVALAKNQCS